MASIFTSRKLDKKSALSRKQARLHAGLSGLLFDPEDGGHVAPKHPLTFTGLYALYLTATAVRSSNPTYKCFSINGTVDDVTTHLAYRTNPEPR
jgi:hypothetical protein